MINWSLGPTIKKQSYIVRQAASCLRDVKTQPLKNNHIYFCKVTSCLRRAPTPTLKNSHTISHNIQGKSSSRCMFKGRLHPIIKEQSHICFVAAFQEMEMELESGKQKEECWEGLGNFKSSFQLKDLTERERERERKTKRDTFLKFVETRRGPRKETLPIVLFFFGPNRNLLPGLARNHKICEGINGNCIQTGFAKQQQNLRY